MDGYLISFFPLAVYAEISILKCGRYLLAVYLHGISKFLSISIAIQISGNHFITYPTRNTDIKAELPWSLVNGYVDVTVPRVTGSLCELQVLAGNLGSQSV